MNDVIEKVRDYAAIAHKGQKRKYTPDPYIVHPVRVMELCKEYTDDITILSAALLHDVLEDTPVDKNELKVFLQSVMNEQMAEKTLELVIDLTDVYTKESFPHLNRKARKARENDRMAKAHPDAQTVKYADIIDNATEIAEYDDGFIVKYLFEAQQLLKMIPKGDKDLYKRAVTTLNKCLKEAKV